MTFTNRSALIRAVLLSASALTLNVALATPAAAQNVTATLGGHVYDGSGAPVAGVVVTARNDGTNQASSATTAADGSYTLAGLRPAAYTVTAAAAGGILTDHVTVEVGQSATLDLRPAAAGAAPVVADTNAPPGTIVVIGRRLVETRTSEVATNVSQQQVKRLPQGDRNFLAFTQLAPGVSYNESETDRGFRSGASTAAAVNVFIDGVNLKSDVLDRGVAGQTDSRGNPFAQLAVQEFRVLTQNYKAEYEQASGAIVTAITKSGTNKFHGDAFVAYTDKNLEARDEFDIRNHRPKPAFKRLQYGVSLGGPIIKDKLFFFGAYEGNDQNRASTVTLGNHAPAIVSQFGKYEGNFVSPFRGDLFFGKLTFLPTNNDTVDLSASRRTETDIGGFGCVFTCTNSFEVAENKKNKTDTALLKWTHHGDGFLNEASIDYLKSAYNPTQLNNTPTLNYQGIITIGGKNGTQDIRQRNLTLRDDFTFSNVEFHGHHVIKAGAKISFQKYDFVKAFHVQPEYIFQLPDISYPQEAFLGLGNPHIGAKNNIFGVFVQDDWNVTEKLQLNLGIRWDRESNMFNNGYVTPANAAAALRAQTRTSYFNPEDYISDGSNRPAYNMIQPRIGFSYDFKGDQSTVLFGGFGRYFDRNVFNNTLDEKFRGQYTDGHFFFSQDGLPRNGNPTVIFNPSYLTREGLIALQATAQTGFPELFAVKNDAKPPRTDQFSLGIRQKLGHEWQGTVTASYIRGKNGYTHLFATRDANGNCCDTTAARAFGYANVLIGVDDLRTRYKALYFQLEKPYSLHSGWGVSLTYTLQKAEQDGNDLFSLDKITPDLYGFRDKAGVERHSIVFSGIVDLPYGFRASTLTKLGSGAAYQVFDANTAPYFSPDTNRIYGLFPNKNCLGLFARCEVDVTLEKEFQTFRGHYLTLGVDLFNAFNNKNYTNFGGFVCCGQPGSNFNLGVPNSLLTLPRRLQFRAAYRF